MAAQKKMVISQMKVVMILNKKPTEGGAVILPAKLEARATRRNIFRAWSFYGGQKLCYPKKPQQSM